MASIRAAARIARQQLAAYAPRDDDEDDLVADAPERANDGSLDPAWGEGLSGYTFSERSDELAELGVYPAPTKTNGYAPRGLDASYLEQVWPAEETDEPAPRAAPEEVPRAAAGVTPAQVGSYDPGPLFDDEQQLDDAQTPDYPALETMDPYERLVFEGWLDDEAVTAARAVQMRAGGQMRDVLASFENVDQRELAYGLSLEAGLPTVNLDGFEADPEVVADLDEAAAVRHLFVPLQREDGVMAVAIADPFDPIAVAAVRKQIGGRFRLVVATADGVLEVLERAFSERRVRAATTGLAESRPNDSAAVVITRNQKLFAIATIVIVLASTALAPVSTAIVINALTAIFYVGAALFRLRLVQLAADHQPSRRVSDAELAELDDRTLPIYTILVPMYKEAAVVPMIGRSLTSLDYPAHKLDILMICEEDDDETIDAVKSLGLGAQFRLVVVPDSKPKTKPKACNYALAHARGEMVVIFDAEDVPEPDQLKRVLVTLEAAPPEVVCVQAKLDYANSLQNLLTRSFTVEYAMWFDLILPGLEEYDAPIPLGGTSNHFKMSVLRELGGWDPFNVTEDADLGIRLYKRGYKTQIVDSITFEEANSQVPNWIRQRSRWVKGHIQTWLVHMRHPVRLWREIGGRAFIGFQFTIGASFVAALINPIYWALLMLWFASHAGLIREVFPGFVYHAAAINLLVWNFAFVYAAAAGVARRGYHELVRSAIYSPFYWALISIAAWKGAIQLITKPFYWEKTVHGLADLSAHQPHFPGRPDAVGSMAADDTR